MRIYRMTEIGDSEAGTPVSDPSDARRVLSYLRKRASWAASDDMIAAVVFDGDKARMQAALRKCSEAGAIVPVG